MSYTVIVDERERERRFENRLNEIHRHCRIGRVRPKMTIHGGQRVPMGPWPYPKIVPDEWVYPESPGSPPIPWWQNPVVSTC